ncbi:hypothetical protein EBZ39_06030 [bacterium]|nr:hypothetical protein [bacterium]
MRKILSLLLLSLIIVGQSWAQAGFNRAYNYGNVNPLINPVLISSSFGGIISGTNVYGRTASFTTVTINNTASSTNIYGLNTSFTNVIANLISSTAGGTISGTNVYGANLSGTNVIANLISSTAGGTISGTNVYGSAASFTTAFVSRSIVGQPVVSNTTAALTVKQTNQSSNLDSGLTIEASNSGNRATFFMDSSARLKIARGSANSQLVFGSTNSAGVFGINLTGAVAGSSDNPSATLHVSGTTWITSWTAIGAGTSPTTPLDVYGKVSATSIQVNSVATCGSADTGVIRFNSVSNTIQFCNGVKFVSLVSGT